jgi:hypothetical protein
MATFSQDPLNPDLVLSKDGQILPKEALAPTDTVLPAEQRTNTAPLGAAPMPAVPGASAAPAPVAPTAASVLDKLNQVVPPPAAPAPAPGLVTTGSQTTTTTTNAMAPSVLNPVLDRNTARAEGQAGAVVQAGEERAQRDEQVAMSTTANAYGRQQVADRDAEQARQRAEIARQSELAYSLQKDPAIDPDRFVRNMSTGASIGTVILAAMNGAFKGMVGQQGNDVLDILQKRIGADIESQKDQIASGRVRRGNLIQYFRDAGLREDAAEKAAEATSWSMLDRMAQAEVQRIGAGEHRTAAALAAEGIRGQAEAKNDELRLTLGQPRSQTSTTVTKQAPSAAGGGLEAFQKQLAARKAYEEAGASPEQLAAFDSAMGIPSPKGESETARTRRESGDRRTEDQAKASGAMAGIEGYGLDAGLVRDPQTGDFRANPADSNTFNARQRERAGSIIPGVSQKLEAAQLAAVEGFGRLQSGGVIGPEEAVRFEKMIASAVTDAQLAENLNAIRRIVLPRLAKGDRGQNTIPYPEVTP